MITIFNFGVASAITQDDLNSIVGYSPFYDPEAADCSADTGTTGITDVSVTGSNVKIAYEFFVANGFTAAQASGIVGNLYEESTGVNPTQWQIGGGGGYGIAQWTPPTTMIAWVTGKGGDPNSLGGQSGQVGQLDYLMYDLNNGNSAAKTAVKGDNTVDSATSDFMNDYERPNKADAALNTRESDALAVYNQYGNGQGGTGATAAGSTSTTAEDTSCGGSVSADGCVNPWSQVKGLGPERIDMGVDYSADPGSPILAMCNAKILGAVDGGTGWDSPTDTQAGVYLQITSGTYTGKTYYVAEDIKPTVTTGQTVTAGQEIATFLPSSTGLETGWGSGTPYGPLAAQLKQECTTGDPGCWSSASGVSFDEFIVATGGTSGVCVPGAPAQSMPDGYPSVSSSEVPCDSAPK